MHNRNLLELNGYKEQSSIASRIANSVASQGASHSVARHSSGNSMTVSDGEQLETKEGWLLKRSYKSPTLIGWQRRY